MSEGKKVKLAFHAVVANCCGNLAVSSIILDAASNVIPSLGGVQVIS